MPNNNELEFSLPDETEEPHPLSKPSEPVEIADYISPRNRNLGYLFTADRALYYHQILVSLLRFRRAHELEPLHEDLYKDVEDAQSSFSVDGTYDRDQFTSDIKQLRTWKLIKERFELERLRGYQDTHRRKYRYSLLPETRAFLEWLEERASEDLDDSGEDTRNLLETVVSAIKELKRALHNVKEDNAKEGYARRALFQLTITDELTHTINNNLISFNERMYGFLMADFSVETARQILDELRVFVEEFLRQIYALRSEIIDNLYALDVPRYQNKILLSLETLKEERKQSVHLIRREINPERMVAIPARLIDVYKEDGQLDQLCRRISKTAKHVWRRLYLHLREKDRKNHRLHDLRARISEIATLEADDVPYTFLFKLISPVQIAVDPNYWSEDEKARPPQPRVYKGRHREVPVKPLGRKKLRGKSARDLEEQQMEKLVTWINEKVMVEKRENTRISDDHFTEFEDLVQMIRLIKAGKLNNGRKLAGAGFWLSHLEGRDQLQALDYTLEIDPIVINRGEKYGK